MIKERIIEGIRDAITYLPDEQLRPTLHAILLIYDEARQNHQEKVQKFLDMINDLEVKDDKEI